MAGCIRICLYKLLDFSYLFGLDMGMLAQRNSVPFVNCAIRGGG